MTNGELIELLQEQPKEEEVNLCVDGCYFEITSVEKEESGIVINGEIEEAGEDEEFEDEDEEEEKD